VTALINLWSHTLAAILFAALAFWQVRRQRHDAPGAPLAAAFAIMAIWAGATAWLGPDHLLSRFSEGARNIAFLAFMHSIVAGAADDGRQRAVKVVYGTVCAVIGLQLLVAGLAPYFPVDATIHGTLLSTAHLLGMTVAAGALILVHNLYGQAAPDSRLGIRLPMIALAGMWAYDLHINTAAHLGGGEAAVDLFAMRGAVAAMLVPLFAMTARLSPDWRMRVSRAATFQSISLIGILVYLLLMMSATKATDIVGGERWLQIGQIGLVVAMTLMVMVLLPSGRARAWLGVVLAKHFFEHRYDYRAEWLRFTRTVGQAGGETGPLDQRVVKALADISGSPGGILLIPDERVRLAVAARWNWPSDPQRGHVSDLAFVRHLEATGNVVDFAEARSGRPNAGGADIPAWLALLDDAWAGVPLLHNDRLVGLVVLGPPLVRRRLDWEDFDLFRAAGIQAASYLAEARSQEALANARRFDEFNRRFAFVLHDIKNLVSQLSLVARNAERHADNPEFRADMVATLQSSVKKMHDLLTRLGSGKNGHEVTPSGPTAIAPIITAVTKAKSRAHPIEAEGEPIFAFADAERLEQALAHLVQNAIDASRAGSPVRISYRLRGREAGIEIADSGLGMSDDFIRTRLFRPFASTKESGFGIGAYEARSLIVAMGGRLQVESRVGEGSRFTIFLPSAAQAEPPAEPHRMSA